MNFKPDAIRDPAGGPAVFGRPLRNTPHLAALMRGARRQPEADAAPIDPGAVVWDAAALAAAEAFARHRSVPLFAAMDGPLASVGRDPRAPSISALLVPLDAGTGSDRDGDRRLVTDDPAPRPASGTRAARYPAGDRRPVEAAHPFTMWSPRLAAAIGERVDAIVAAGIGDETLALARDALAAIRAEGLLHVTPVVRTAAPWDQAEWRIVVVGSGAQGRVGQPDALAAGDRARLARALAQVGADRILAVSARPDSALARAAQACGVAAVSVHEVPAGLLAAAGEVWTAGGRFGFDALVHGAKVRLFGPAFYGDRGLTADEADTSADALSAAGRAPRRAGAASPGVGAKASAADGLPAGAADAPPSLGAAGCARPPAAGSATRAPPPGMAIETLFAAVALEMTRYADPVRREPVGILDAVDRLTNWRSQLAARPAHVVCVRFDHWKWPIARGFFGDGTDNVSFASAPGAVKAARRRQATIYVWGSSASDRVRRRIAAEGAAVPVAQIEDGFIRSVGLGSDFRWPASYAIDDVGIYYDARRPSRLERILSETDFDPGMLQRARRLRRLIRDHRVSKYNIGPGGTDSAIGVLPGGRRRVLVVGQVPTDASLAHGQAMFGGDNLPFLAAVRAAEPDAFLIYKEHPELVRRNRPGWLTPQQVAPHADLFLQSGDTMQIVGAVDHLHTMTSLAGFEALLHDKPVTCWGMPFYAGWGLTEDKLAAPRRARARTIDELVAAALIAYPVYVDPVTQIPCEVEDIVEQIGGKDAPDAAAGAGQGWPLATRSLAGIMRLRVLAFTYLEHPLVLLRRRRLVRDYGLR